MAPAPTLKKKAKRCVRIGRLTSLRTWQFYIRLHLISSIVFNMSCVCFLVFRRGFSVRLQVRRLHASSHLERQPEEKQHPGEANGQRDVMEAWPTCQIYHWLPSDTNRTLVSTKKNLVLHLFRGLSCLVLFQLGTLFSLSIFSTHPLVVNDSKNNKKHFQRKQGKRRLPLKVPAHREVNAGRKCHLKQPLPACAIVNTRRDQKKRAWHWRERLRPLLE